LVCVGGVIFALWQILRASRSSDTPTGRPALEVSKDPDRRAYRSIREALAHAHAGDVIELADTRHVETVIVDPSRPTAVTIQAKPGTTVVWSPSLKDPDQPLLFLSGARGFKLNGKGITLDGTIDDKTRVKTLVSLQLYSPGLVLEDAQLRGFENR